MKNTKSTASISYMGTRVWPTQAKPARTKIGHFTSFRSAVKKAVRWFLIRAGIGLAAFALLAVGYLYHSVTAPNLSVINQIVAAPVNDIAPVMERILKAESGNHHFAANGQVLVHINKNNTVDVGVAQINLAVWGKKAKELGYDLFNEEDNRAFAEYLYRNYGTEPWYSSSKNW